MRAAVHEMMRWWLDRGVDGFRMDVINLISKDPGLPDGELLPNGYGDGMPHFSYGPRVHDYLAEVKREVFDARPGTYLTVGEMPGVTPEQALRFTDRETGELDMVFQFEHVDLDHEGPKWNHRPLSLIDLKASLGRWQTALGDRGWNSLYWNNHDQPRVVSRFGDDSTYWRESATALATVLHLHRGTPYVYQGEELGMTNVPFDSIDDFQDIESVNHFHEAVALGADPADVLVVAPAHQPGQRPHADAVDRRAGSRFHHGPPLDPRQPEPHLAQRGGTGPRPGVGPEPLPGAHRPSAPRAGRRGRRLHDAAARPPVGVRVRATAGERVPRRLRQPLRRAGRRRAAGEPARRGAAALQPAVADDHDPPPVGGPRLSDQVTSTPPASARGNRVGLGGTNEGASDDEMTRAGDRETYHGYSVDDEDQPQSTGDSLVTTTVALRNRSTRATRHRRSGRPAQKFGNTPLEEAMGETLDQRVEQEVPEADPYEEAEATPVTVIEGGLEDEVTEVGDERAGRLVEPDEGAHTDTEPKAVADRCRHRRSRRGRRGGRDARHRRGPGPAVTSHDQERDEERVEQRASELLPEELAAGSDVPHEQAEAILAESDERTDDPERTQRESSQTLDDKLMGG